MNTNGQFFSGGIFILSISPIELSAARNSADLQPPQVRQLSVTNAEKLWQRRPPPPVPADMPSPFSPVDFDKPDPSDFPATGALAGPAEVKRITTGPGVQRYAPSGDREVLDKLAAQISPTGVIMLRGAPRLVISNRPFEVGTRFTATYNNQDYELELVAIDRTTFTLRYRSEEVIRPIKPVR
jgi:hypothetical protein